LFVVGCCGLVCCYYGFVDFLVVDLYVLGSIDVDVYDIIFDVEDVDYYVVFDY